MSENVTVTIHNQSDGSIRTAEVRKGLGFQAMCAKDPTLLEFDCREADCGICIFRVLKGAENLSKPNAREKDFLNAMKADASERLACQSRILGDIEIQIDDFSVPEN